MSFTRMIVTHVIHDVSIPREELALLCEGIDNKKKLAHTIGPDKTIPEEDQVIEYYMIAPRNSVIAKPAESANKKDTKGSIVYPFFSSHMCLPVKPGEHIWAVDAGGTKYWLTRVCESDYVEDLNFTHADRRGLPAIPSVNEIPETSTKSPIEVVEKLPVFPVGTNIMNRNAETAFAPGEQLPTKATMAKLEPIPTPNSFSLPHFHSYLHIMTGSKEANRIAYEPIPRFTKRPGDLVLQGSNNTLISLSTERGYGAGQTLVNSVSNSDPSKDLPVRTLNEGIVSDADGAPIPALDEAMGAIDIVAGRGRLTKPSADLADADPESPTAPRIAKNARDKYENYTLVGLDSEKASDGGALIDVSEGDPDFANDACRIYMSMKTSPDLLLRKETAYPKVASGASNTDADVEFVNDAASIIVKSDEIRIVARKDIKGETGTHGSIKIVKEGTEDTDQAVIIMQADGTILIDGPKVIIGGGGLAAGNGEGTQVAVGRGATEPMVLGQVLLDKITALETSFNNHIHNSGAGPTTMHHSDSGGPGTKSAEAWTEFLSKLGKTL